jgi:hypothetical protein
MPFGNSCPFKPGKITFGQKTISYVTFCQMAFSPLALCHSNDSMSNGILFDGILAK